MKYPILIISLLLIFACHVDTSRNKKKTENYDKIIFLDHYYSNYLSELQNRGTDSLALFKELVEKPIYESLSGAEYFELLTSTDLFAGANRLRTVLKQMRLNETYIKRSIQVALNSCNEHVKQNSLNIYIFPVSANGDEILTRMGGITGMTLGRKYILIWIDPTAKNWEETLKSCIAHEFHHAYAMDTTENSWPLLERMIFEGRADMFAHIVYPLVVSPWTKKERQKEIAPLWDKIKNRLQDRSYKFGNEVMFGSAEWPEWTGYTLGYSIVESCLKNKPQMTVLEWTKMKPEEILKLSDFKL
jgi:uncharacterized protein YjaZ